jgi:hypothetical protein
MLRVFEVLGTIHSTAPLSHNSLLICCVLSLDLFTELFGMTVCDGLTVFDALAEFASLAELAGTGFRG